MGLGIFLLVRGDAGSGIWWILMGWFLGQSATGAVVSSRFSERLEGVTVADVMDTQPVWVPGDTTVLQAQDEFFLRYRWPWFPVADPTSGRFLGLLHQDRVDGAVQEGQPGAARLRRGRRRRRRGLPRPRRHPDRAAPRARRACAPSAR